MKVLQALNLEESSSHCRGAWEPFLLAMKRQKRPSPSGQLLPHRSAGVMGSSIPRPACPPSPRAAVFSPAVGAADSGRAARGEGDCHPPRAPPRSAQSQVLACAFQLERHPRLAVPQPHGLGACGAKDEGSADGVFPHARRGGASLQDGVLGFVQIVNQPRVGIFERRGPMAARSMPRSPARFRLPSRPRPPSWNRNRIPHLRPPS